MGALGDIIVSALKELLKVLFSPIRNVIENHGATLIQTILGTPHPNAVFSKPTNRAWPDLYEFHWGTMVPLSLGLWGVSIALVIFLESTSHLFSSYHRSKLKRRAFSGLLGILAWWWIAALSLRFMEALTVYLAPSLSTVSLFETLSFTAMGVLGLVLALMTDFILFILIGLIYFLRHVMLYLFVLMMPILIVLWIPGVGPFTLVSKFMKRLAGFYVPFLFMSVPVALLLRLGEILGSNAGLSMGGIGAWLTGLVIPLVAVASPFVLFWQAGALFFMADRAASHASAQRAKRRLTSARDKSGTATQGGRNFVRGAQGKPAVRPDGQAVLASGNSRAHAVGSRLKSSSPSLRDRLSTSGNGNGSGGSASTGHERSEYFETLRNRTDGGQNSRTSDSTYSENDRPWYIN